MCDAVFLISAWWFVHVGPLFCPLAGAGEGSRPWGDLPLQVGAGVPIDVDHDLIAGSHPVLKFEFAGYLTRLSKHWNGRDEGLAKLDFELCAWATGQLAAAEASLE